MIIKISGSLPLAARRCFGELDLSQDFNMRPDAGSLIHDLGTLDAGAGDKVTTRWVGVVCHWGDQTDCGGSPPKPLHTLQALKIILINDQKNNTVGVSS